MHYLSLLSKQIDCNKLITNHLYRDPNLAQEDAAARIIFAALYAHIVRRTVNEKRKKLIQSGDDDDFFIVEEPLGCI